MKYQPKRSRARWLQDAPSYVPELHHRYFAFIASVIGAMPAHAATLRAQKRSTALAFADACGDTNPRFDRRQFLAACGEGE